MNPDTIEHLRYSVRLKINGFVVAAFVEAGAAFRMMHHENNAAVSMGARPGKYETFDNKDQCVMTWGAKR